MNITQTFLWQFFLLVLNTWTNKSSNKNNVCFAQLAGMPNFPKTFLRYLSGKLLIQRTNYMIQKLLKSAGAFPLTSGGSDEALQVPKVILKTPCVTWFTRLQLYLSCIDVQGRAGWGPAQAVYLHVSHTSLHVTGARTGFGWSPSQGVLGPDFIPPFSHISGLRCLCPILFYRAQLFYHVESFFFFLLSHPHS